MNLCTPARRTPLLILLAVLSTAAISCGNTKPVKTAAATTEGQSQMATKAPQPVPTPPPQPATAPPAANMLASDPQARNKEIVAHLDAVLKYWRTAESPIQKVGEPSDLIYRNQAVDYAAQIASDAFQSATAEAVLLQPFEQAQSAAATPSQSQRLQALHSTVTQRMAALKTQQETLHTQLQHAHGDQVATLQQQLEQTEGEMELQTAMDQALTRLSTLSTAKANTGLEADVQQLKSSAPDLTNPKARLAAPVLESVSSARSAGVTTKASVLFQLMSTRSALDSLIHETAQLRAQADHLRQPLQQMLRLTIQKGEQMTPSDAATPAPAPIPPAAAKPAHREHAAAKASSGDSAKAATSSATPAAPAQPSIRKQYDDLTNTFKGLSAASVPLSQEVATLDQIQADLTSWRAAVNEEYTGILTSLLIRVAAIAIALVVISIIGLIWRRATTRYVRDVRRRRQLMVMRRLVLGFLTGITLIFGFVTQFSSLATFAGFITAGIAVGLQTILLSVAAYFFIIGRYGVRVGDRITIANVTGDVIEVGIVRFYVLEMAPSGSAFHATGRVAVFSNAVLFQAGTPLFKQMPGTEYAWHQIVVKLASDKDYQAAIKLITEAVSNVYESYRPRVERQHQALESWMDSAVDAPAIQSSLQLTDAGLQFWIRYPVVLRDSAQQDQEMSEALLDLMAANQTVKEAVLAAPAIDHIAK